MTQFSTSERRATWVYYKAVPQLIGLLAAVLAPGDDRRAVRAATPGVTA